MFRITRRNGTLQELAEVQTADVEREEVVCRDSQGVAHAHFQKLEVTVLEVTKEAAEAFEEEKQGPC